ncbi:MAG: VOC family protein [Chloroflexi bacterium]|nr:VOC family protein [Chloroflexota bacterium]
MACRLTEVVIDCHDPRTLADFWRQVLGYQVVEELDEIIEIGPKPPNPADIRQGPVPPVLTFIKVPESKGVKNRLHLDVSPTGDSQSEQLDRLLALGARRIDIGQGDQPWVVLADPEGNEFCLLSTLAP